jgi:hypothetical protein
MTAWQTYRSLTPEQKEILRTKQVDLNKPREEVMALLNPLALFDRSSDKLRTRFGCTAAICFVVAFVSFFFLLGVSFGKFVSLFILLAAIFSLVVWSKLRSVDLSNNLRGVCLPMLGVLKEDFDRQEPVHLRLDLRPPTCDEKKISESPKYESGVYHKVIDSFYTDPWMTGEGVLQDGTRLHWDITDNIRKRDKTKKTPRGKYKSKTKYTKKTTIEVEAGLRKKTYDVVVSPTKSDEKKNVVRNSRSVRTDSLDPIPPREVIDVIAGIFRSARPAQKGA